MRKPDLSIGCEAEDLQRLDALLVAPPAPWWDRFYADRARPCPFFVTAPDESLVEWTDEGLLRPGRAIDLGCGNARNAIFLARRGFATEGIDQSQVALDWARDNVAAAGVQVPLTQQSIFDVRLDRGSYDLVYDGGCFHHIAPHRRDGYVRLVVDALKPGGWFGLTCFRPEGGSGLTDEEVYRRGSMGGGLGYTQDRLREIWSHGLQVRVLRQMRKPGPGSGLFGEDFLWVLLAQKA
jgi:SAM-dependent methyltransferase